MNKGNINMIKRSYFYLYYKIFQFFKSLSDDALNNWKPLIIICLLQLFIIISIDLWIKILIGKSYFLEQSNIILWIICVGLALVNYYILLGQNKWKSHIPAFRKYTRNKDLIVTLMVILTIFGIFFFMIYSFYIFSQIKR